MALRRAAIYGGTFDPVHNGHLEVARRVGELFSLDEVIFVPACVPPHKRNASITSPSQRFAMLALATAENERWRISTVELDSPERPYAVETVAHIQNELGAEYRIFFMMGADSWLEIPTWHDWERLLTMCDQIVVTRPGFELSADGITSGPARVVDLRGLGKNEISVLIDGSSAPRTFFTDATRTDISATAIRAATRAGDHKKLREMVPLPVAGYIEEYGLYTN